MRTSPLSESTWNRYQPIDHMNVTAVVWPSKPTCTDGRPSCSLVSAILCGTRPTLRRSTPRCRRVREATSASRSAAVGAAIDETTASAGAAAVIAGCGSGVSVVSGPPAGSAPAAAQLRQLGGEFGGRLAPGALAG